MIVPDSFAEVFARNQNIIRKQTDGLSDADSLLQPPSGGNCLNWVLGHMLFHRGRALLVLGRSPDWLEATARYQRESEPVTGPSEDLLSLEQLLDLLQRAQEEIATSLRVTSAEALEARAGEKTRREYLELLLWHETYHLGQLECLRHLAGKNDKVI